MKKNQNIFHPTANTVYLFYKILSLSLQYIFTVIKLSLPFNVRLYRYKIAYYLSHKVTGRDKTTFLLFMVSKSANFIKGGVLVTWSSKIG